MESNHLSNADNLILRVVVLKVGRVAIITRGRYAGKKVNFSLLRNRSSYEMDDKPMSEPGILEVRMEFR